MENIDELFRKTFREEVPDERFPLDEVHWEQARRLLEGNDRRKRRAFWLWWLLGLAGLLISAGGYWLWSGHGKATVTTEETVAAVQNAPDKMPLSAVRESNAPTTSSVPPTISTQIPKQEHPKNTSGNSQNQQSTQSTVVGGQHENSTIKNRTWYIVNQKEDTQSGETTPSPSLSSVVENPPSTVHPLPSTLNPQPSTLNPQPSEAKTSASSVSSVVENPPSTVHRPPSTVHRLPLTYPALEKTSQPLEIQPIAALKHALIEPQPIKRFRFSLWVAGSAYRPEVDYGRWIGASAGLSVQRQFGRHWGLRTGLGWRLLPVQDPGTDSVQTFKSTTAQFSFGARQAVATATRLQIHSMELPLSLTWTKGILQLEAGAAVGMRTGIHSILRIENSEPFADLVVSEKTVWLDGANTRRYWVTPFAGLSATHRSVGLFAKAGLLPNSFSTNQSVMDAAANPRFRPYIDLGLNIVIR